MFGLLGWKEVTDTRTQQGLDRIRRSYQKKEFLMARVTLDSMEYHPAENVVAPVITIDSGPRVVVRTKGAKISRGRLRELVPIYQEQTVDKDLLVEGKRELTEYLQAKGYFDAQVDFDMSKTPEQEELIEYSLFPGERHKLVAVEVEGNRYFRLRHPARADVYDAGEPSAIPTRPLQSGLSPARHECHTRPVPIERFSRCGSHPNGDRRLPGQRE